MILHRLETWLFNHSKKDVTLHDLNVVLKRGKTVNIFAKLPNLTGEEYLQSKNKGSLYNRRTLIKEVLAPISLIHKTVHTESKVPRRSLGKGMVCVTKEEEDYIDMLGESFPKNAQPLTREEAWNQERQKVLKDLEQNELGEDGEVFADFLFEGEDDGLDDGF